jgi:type 1 glutamine amidotransferase/HEAT repeat protein
MSGLLNCRVIRKIFETVSAAFTAATLLILLAAVSGQACRAPVDETPPPSDGASGEDAGPDGLTEAQEATDTPEAAVSRGNPGFLPPADDLGKAIAAAAPSFPAVPPGLTRRILVFSRCEGYVHSVIPTANRAFVILGDKTGAFEADFAEGMDAFARENLKKYDAILFNNTTHLAFEDETHRRNLIDFVREGKGIIGIHAAADNFFDWPEAAAMMGGLFDGHPWGAQGTWAVKIDEPDHPLNRAFGGKGFLVRDEIYQFKDPYSRDRLRVLLSLDMSNGRNRDVEGIKRDDGDFAISWMRGFGAGRVFYCSLGHNEEIFSDGAILSHMLDGIQYALGDLKVDAAPSGSLTGRQLPARTTDQGGIEDPFMAAAGYEYGTSRRFLAVIEEQIRQASIPERAAIEDRFIAILQSPSSTPAGRQFACRMLRRTGTEKAVPVLASMLEGEEDADNARLALEGLAAAGVDAALLKALGRCRGETRIGVIGSIGRREIAAAVPALAGLLVDTDRRTAAAAIASLGRIAGADALGFLSRANLPEDLLPIRDDALMLCADKLTEQGKGEEALAIYQSLAGDEKPVTIRIAAYRGILSARPGRMIATIALLFREQDKRFHEAAGLFTCELPEDTDTSLLIDDVSSLPAGAQVILLGALAARGDRAAASAAAEAARTGECEPVRIAALEALGALGGPPHIAILADAAAAGNTEGKTAAESLIRLTGDGIDAALVSCLREKEGMARAVLLRTLAERGPEGAGALLLEYVRNDEDHCRAAAIEGLKKTGTAGDLPALLDLLANPFQEGDRAGIEKILLETCRRAEEGPGRIDPLLAALPGTNAATRASLLNVLGEFPCEISRTVLEEAADDEEKNVREAAVRALAAWPDSGPLEKLLDLALSLKEPGLHRLALKGAIRMAGDDAGSEGAGTEDRFKRIKAATRSPGEINMVLAGASGIPKVWVLDFVQPCFEDSATRTAAKETERKVSAALARMVQHDGKDCPVEQANPCSEKYTGGGPGALTDGKWGSKSYGDGCWQAFKSKDMIAVVDLGRETALRDIRAGFLMDNKSWIFLPRKVIFSLSTDGVNYTTVATVEKNDPGQIVPSRTDDFFVKVNNLPARFVRVHAVSVVSCPTWHPGNGGDAWLFADEIQINAHLPARENR